MAIRSLLLGAVLPVIMTALSACQTTGTRAQTPAVKTPASDTAENIDPDILPPNTPPNIGPQSSPEIAPKPTSESTPEATSGLIDKSPILTEGPIKIGSSPVHFPDYLPGWEAADFTPALTALARTCAIWERRGAALPLRASRPELGTYQDWQTACYNLPPAPYSAGLARWFFESQFLPYNLLVKDSPKGLLTGYYEPEIDVRALADHQFSEPILARPTDEALQNKARTEIIKNQAQYKTLAYGRPIDVFFMQVQGSGRIRFEGGSVKRAAFGGHNAHKYKSIGGVLVRRGEITLEEASKQSIENWMVKSGPEATRDLMNENQRYIYFALEDINPDEGPKGSFRVPLTAMGSMAIDPKQNPYGLPVWLETTLPEFGGDFQGRDQGLLVITQDSGSAIKGVARGDLFFGSGDLAGERAGVMKHDVVMTLLLPRGLVLKALGVAPE